MQTRVLIEWSLMTGFSLDSGINSGFPSSHFVSLNLLVDLGKSIFPNVGHPASLADGPI